MIIRSYATFLYNIFKSTFCLLLLSCSLQIYAYENNPDIDAFIEDLVINHAYERKDLQKLFAQLENIPEVLEKISNPYEALPWHKYRGLFVNDKKISSGVKFWQEHEQLLARAESDFGVPAEMIVAIIGVETAYGKNTGKYPVISALATLAFSYPPRATFFRAQLKEYLLLIKEQKLDAHVLRGSYAGAIGIPQFIPSSYRKFAIDFDKSGSINLCDNVAQAIGSVANYFKMHGWKAGALVAVPATLNAQHSNDLPLASNNNPKPSLSLQTLEQHGVKPSQQIKNRDANVALLKFDDNGAQQYWLGLNNFYVITRYNHSSNYALAVFQLSQEISKQYKLAAKG